MGQSRSKLIPDEEEGHEIGMPVTPQRSATTSRAKRRQKKKSSEESVAEPTSRRRSTSLRYGTFSFLTLDSTSWIIYLRLFII